VVYTNKMLLTTTATDRKPLLKFTCPVNTKVNVLDARYGVPDSFIDVTPKLQQMVNGISGGYVNQSLISLAGGQNPAINQVKTMIVDYECI
jgi:hypothetical protein